MTGLTPGRGNAEEHTIFGEPTIREVLRRIVNPFQETSTSPRLRGSA